MLTPNSHDVHPSPNLPPAGQHIAVIVTGGDSAPLREIAAICQPAAAQGAAVRIFFRDESIPLICRPDRAQPLGRSPEPEVAEILEPLRRAGDVRLYACSSSLYLWGLSAADLSPWIDGARGLVAFLVEDLGGASQVLSY